MAKDSMEILRTVLLRRIIGKNIKELRKKHNLTQEELAFITGINRTSITKYETFKAFPTLENLLIISQALKESPEALLSGWENLFKSTRKQNS